MFTSRIRFLALKLFFSLLGIFKFVIGYVVARKNRDTFATLPFGTVFKPLGRGRKRGSYLKIDETHVIQVILELVNVDENHREYQWLIPGNCSVEAVDYPEKREVDIIEPAGPESKAEVEQIRRRYHFGLL